MWWHVGCWKPTPIASFLELKIGVSVVNQFYTKPIQSHVTSSKQHRQYCVEDCSYITVWYSYTTTCNSSKTLRTRLLSAKREEMVSIKSKTETTKTYKIESAWIPKKPFLRRTKCPGINLNFWGILIHPRKRPRISSDLTSSNNLGFFTDYVTRYPRARRGGLGLYEVPLLHMAIHLIRAIEKWLRCTKLSFFEELSNTGMG